MSRGQGDIPPEHLGGRDVIKTRRPGVGRGEDKEKLRGREAERERRQTYSSAGLTLIAISTNSPFGSKMKCDRHELGLELAFAPWIVLFSITAEKNGR